MTNTTLFTLSRSWHDSAWLFEQIAFAGKGDAIILIQDAVLGLQSPITLASFLGKCEALGVSVCALREDCMLRGVDNQYPKIPLVDYSGFVDCVTQYSKQVCW